MSKLIEIVTAWGNSLNPTKEQTGKAKQRYEICIDCPAFKSFSGVEYCNECGCPISKKIYSNENSCPLNKWKE